MSQSRLLRVRVCVHACGFKGDGWRFLAYAHTVRVQAPAAPPAAAALGDGADPGLHAPGDAAAQRQRVPVRLFDPCLARSQCPPRAPGIPPKHTHPHHITSHPPSPHSGNRLCRFALIGVTAGGMGLDLSAASTAVFLELPPQVADLRQAEDRCVCASVSVLCVCVDGWNEWRAGVEE